MAFTACGSESSAYSTPAGSWELNSSTVVRVRARHRGQCLIAGRRAFAVIVKRQRGQFRYRTRRSRSDLDPIVTAPSRTARGHDPHKLATRRSAGTRKCQRTLRPDQLATNAGTTSPGEDRCLPQRPRLPPLGPPRARALLTQDLGCPYRMQAQPASKPGRSLQHTSRPNQPLPVRSTTTREVTAPPPRPANERASEPDAGQ